MEQLIQLRMQGHELTMRQMVEEIHRGNLNIGQAAARFEVNRKTVKHWLDKVESEVTVLEEQVRKEPVRSKKKPSRPRAVEQPNARVEELMAKVHSLEQDLEAARFKALYYSPLVRVAEQELGIDIEKKSATK